MDRQEKIDFILDHYENPRHYGAISDPTISQRGGNPGCGDIVTVFLRIGKDGQIEDMSFEGEGCTISQAAASFVTELFEGKTIADIESASANEVLDVLGREIAGTRLKCALLGLNTAKEAARRYRTQRQAVDG